MVAYLDLIDEDHAMRTKFWTLVILVLLGACGSGGTDATTDADAVSDAVIDTCSVFCGDDPCKNWRVDDTCTCVLDGYRTGEACDDQSACTTGDQCQADGSCAGTAIEVDDGLACTDDLCDAKAGLTHAVTAGFCLIDGTCYAEGAGKLGDVCYVCTPASSAVAWVPNPTVSCDDGDPCTTDDVCGVTGACEGTARDCDDQNACTFDECRPEVGCAHDAVNRACDHGDACTEDDRCDGGQCAPGTPVDCDDGDLCTADGCDSAAGCVHGPDLAACDDDNDCTLDACVDGGCTHEPLGSGACDDHDACTLGDVCVAGACVAGTEVPVCDDSNPCTDDACVPAAGCVNAFNSEPCDDGVACTDVDTCVYGVCVGADTQDLCPACQYVVSGQVQKSLMIQMGSDGKAGSGLDVDGDPATCAPAGKCNGGIDNALALLSLFLNPLFTDGLDAGDLIFIVEFQQPTFDGQAFTLNTFFGLPHPYLNPGCAASENCIYVLPYYNFTPDCQPLVSLPDATIVDGHISAGGKEAVFPLVLPFDTGITVQLTLLWARFEGDVVADENGVIQSMDGVVGGAVPKAALVETINAIPDGYFTMDKAQLLTLLDQTVDQDIDLDGDGQVDALSIGFRFSTVPTTVTGL